jgi:O-methyltransferase involved in polyketide biosynthesis
MLRAMQSPDRDFTTITPTAKSLLLMRSQTALPFARPAAEIVFGAAGIAAGLAEIGRLPGAELLMLHFENRYRSLDTLLADHVSTAAGVLELAAGLSFRGLELARQGRFYVDTDLPALVEVKAGLIARLHPEPLAGTLKLRALDALDRDAFLEAIALIPPGPVAIVNEGLLVYLDDAEKHRLADNVRAALAARGGVWITGDIYVTTPPPAQRPDPRVRDFLDRHRIEDHLFAGWDAAERWFADSGLAVVRKLSPSSDPRHARESWVLGLA